MDAERGRMDGSTHADHGPFLDAEERARLSKTGLTPSFADGQIAAVAAVNDLTLVTDVADFENFDGLRIERWHQPST